MENVLRDGNKTILVAAIEYCNIYTLDSNRYGIVKCLIRAGSALDPPEDNSDYKDRGESSGASNTPLEAAITSVLWPIVEELLEASSQISTY